MDLLHKAAAEATNTTMPDDGVFGPQYGDYFDFTMPFDNTIFTILPASLMIGACPFYICWYYDMPFLTSKKNLLWVKLLLTCCLFVFELARSVVWHSVQNSSNSALLEKTTMTTIVLSNFYTITLGICLCYDHLCAPQSTTFLSLFLVGSTFTEGVRARSFSLRGGLDDIVGLTIGCILTKLFLIIILEMPKTLDSPDYRDKNKEMVWDDKAGFWGRVLVVCANSVFFRGFRNHLSMDDLGVLAPRETSEQLAARFEPIWESTNKLAANSLFKACCWAMRWQLISAWTLCVCRSVFEYVNVFVMKMTLERFQASGTTAEVYNAVIGANVLIYSVQAITNSLFLRAMNHLSLHIRGTLVGQMAKKTTELTTDQAQQAALLGLMTADIDGVIGGVEEIFELSLVIPALAAGFYFLQQQVGNAFFTPVVPIILSVLVGTYTGAQTVPAMRKWNHSIQTRVARTATIISQSIGIKMMGLETTMVRYLETLRSFEVSQSMRARQMRVITMAALPLNYWFTPTVVFVAGVYWTVWKDSGLDPVKPWVAFGFVNLIRIPMWYLLKSWTIIGTLFAGIGRIQEYLLLTEKPDIRRLRKFSNSQASRSSNESLVEKSTKGSEKIKEEMLNRCISLRMVSVPSNQPGQNILQNLDLGVPASKLTMVVGPVGSGKTVFLKTLLGETVATGTIEMSSFDIAFCDQRPWLPAGTIQHAITAYSEFDKARYDSVVTACSLDPDITAIGGNDSQIGSNGSMLSGGQKQRVALARALYSSKPIVLFDDVLSSLDSETAKDIFEAVFSENGMLKKQNRTVLFATHERAWVASADQVIQLDDEGSATVHKGKTEIEKFLKLNTLVAGINTMETAPQESKETSSGRELEYARQDRLKPANKLDTSLYRYMFKSVSAFLLGWSLLNIGFNGFMERGPELVLRIWLGEDPKDKAYALSMVVLSFFTVFSIGYSAYVYCIQIIPKIAKQTHSTFANAVLRATLPFLTSTSNGVLINRFSQDMTLFGQEMPWALYSALHLTAIYLTNIGLIVAGTDYTAIAVPIFLLILWFLQKFYVRTSRQIRLLDLEAKTPLYDLVGETVSGLETIRGYGWKHPLIQAFYACLDYSQRGYYSLLTIQRWLKLVADILGVIMAAVLVSTALRTNAATQPGLGLAMLSLTNFGGLSKQMIEKWTHMETSLGAVRRLRDFEHDTPRETDHPEAKDPPDSWPTQGLVEFKSVSASYQSDNGEASPALERVSVLFAPGQRVLITGRTGSGKSTMMLAMLNLIKFEGEILIDHKDIAKIPHDKHREQITTIPQDSLHIPGSTLQNLLPWENGNQAPGLLSDEMIQGVLQDVTLWDHIEAKGGLEVPFEDMYFSAGQKQLLCIARAILHHTQFNTKIVLMDEVTSNLDNEAREAVLDTMNIAFRGCTRIEISHNMRDTVECDVILTLSNGWLIQTDIVDRVDDVVEREFPGSTTAGSSSVNPEAATSTETSQQETSQQETSQQETSQQETDQEEAKPEARQAAANPDATILEGINSGPTTLERAAPEGDTNTEEGSVQTQPQPTSEGELPTGATSSSEKSLDIEANAKSSTDSQECSIRASSGGSRHSQSALCAASTDQPERQPNYIVSPGTKARGQRQHAPPRLPSPFRESDAGRDTTELYMNTYELENGETRVTYTLRREDLKFAQHQTPYLTKLPTEREMMEEKKDKEEAERQRLLKMEENRIKYEKILKERAERINADTRVFEPLQPTVWDGKVASTSKDKNPRTAKKIGKGKKVGKSKGKRVEKGKNVESYHPDQPEDGTSTAMP